MRFAKICLLATAIVALSNIETLAQAGDYQSFATLKPDMQRKVFANELFLTLDGKYLIVNYGDKPTFIVAYSIEDWQQAALFRLTNWVDFATAYSDTATQQFYVKTSRGSSKYHRLDIEQKTQDIIPCDITPRGCPHIEMKKNAKMLYTADKKYYITIDKQNKREVKVYKLRTAE